ncbi:MAG: type II toxin-antitoxin system VapC family toxin [Candidatus Verstraetearchaeota archaeon]|nr:type II toxin-antitoxin system VapC family toxin [Candidatus Verstraetearchaeota archaeon]
MIVVDASAVIAFFLKEKCWESLKPYMKETISIDHIIKEFYNAVWKATYLLKILDHKSAYNVIKLFNIYLEKNIIIEPETKYIDKAFNIALEKGISIYDALYIALAISKNMSLLTLDEKQKNVALELGAKVLP